MRYARSASMFFDTPLALLPSKAEEILAFWRSKLAGVDLDVTRYEAAYEPLAARFYSLNDDFATGGRAAPSGNSIAVLSLHGVMSKRMNLMAAISGGTSTDMFAKEFREQLANPDVAAVVIDVDSPGGSVYGLQELADVIFSARGDKQIVAQVDPLAASAAYHIASQADEIVVTPSGELGHIGVSALHLDYSQKAETEGIRPYLITAGKYKHEQAAGSNLVPPSEEALANWQARVDEVYGHFVANVARGRGVKASEVREGFGQGRVVGAAEAVRLGMADRIATMEETLERLASSRRRSRVGRRAELASELEKEPAPEDDEDEDEDEAQDEPDDADPEAQARLSRFRLKAFQARAAAGAV